MLPKIVNSVRQAEKSARWILVGGGTLFVEHSSHADRISMP
jgi:hypothetical protein